MGEGEEENGWWASLGSTGYVWVLNDGDDFMDVYLSPNSSCSIHEIFLHINHIFIKYF